MYLNRLNREKKELFLDLCIHAAAVNHVHSEEQHELISQYCCEMQLCDATLEVNISFEDAMTKLVQICSKSELKIIVLELTALLLSDNEYDDFEIEFMNEVTQMAIIDKSQHNEMIELLNELFALYKRISSFVFDN